MSKVLIVQHRLLHYRVELFNCLRQELAANGVELELICGRPSERDEYRKDEGVVNWSCIVRNLYLYIKGVEIIFQLLPLKVFTADLVVLMQENRILSNYPVIIIRGLLGKKTAYWGHGYNMQSTAKLGVRERWKLLWLKSVNWWFAYTSGTSQYLIEKGYDSDCITVLNNAVNVSLFSEMVAQVTDDELAKLDAELGICEKDRVAVFCGSIYKEKKIDFMLNQCAKVYASNDSFRLVVIGAGPDQGLVEEFASNNIWVKYVGVKKGLEKAIFYKRASIMLNPGLVGLHVLDSFAAGIPMLTTFEALHSPEYEYLSNGNNGLIVSDNGDEYAETILDVIGNREYLGKLAIGAKKSALIYSLENMVHNFKLGLLKSLGVN